MDVHYSRPIVKNPVVFPLMDDGNPNCQGLEREAFLIVDEPPVADGPPEEGARLATQLHRCVNGAGCQ